MTVSSSALVADPDGRSAAEPGHAPKETGLTGLWRYLRHQRRRFGLACSASVVNKIFDLMPPVMVGWVIDTVEGDAPGWVDTFADMDDPTSVAFVLGGLILIVHFFESVFEFVFRLLFMTLAQDIQHDLRMDVYMHLQFRETSFFDHHRLGVTMSMLNDDVNQLENFLNNGFNDLLQLGVLLVFCAIVLFLTSWPLALVGIVPFPLIVFGSIKYHRLIAPRYSNVRNVLGLLNSRLENNIGGIAVIKSFTAEHFERDRVAKASQEYQRANLSAIRVSALWIPVIRMAVAFSFAAIVVIGSRWILRGEDRLTSGELVLFTMLIQRMLWPLTRFGQVLDNYERASASARRTFSLLNTPSKIVDPENPKSLGNVRGHVCFRDVEFSYDESSRNRVLRGLSFEVKPGQFIGVAGTTGAGKSTIVSLLLRLYDVSKGSVSLDGVDVRSARLRELRSQISLVSQDVYVFHGTIEENILYGRPGATHEDVIKAAQHAELHDFIETLPLQYDAVVGERGLTRRGLLTARSLGAVMIAAPHQNAFSLHDCRNPAVGWSAAAAFDCAGAAQECSHHDHGRGYECRRHGD
eukprot:m.48017 g.48017  ORF g.48017 m.48017 type:complete len:579 (-) comp6398_c0_seq2:427-2163(-)